MLTTGFMARWEEAERKAFSFAKKEGWCASAGKSVGSSCLDLVLEQEQELFLSFVPSQNLVGPSQNMVGPSQNLTLEPK